MTTRQSLNAPAEGTKYGKDMPLQFWIVLYKSSLKIQWKIHFTLLFGSCKGLKLCLRHYFSCGWQTLDPYREANRAPIEAWSIPADTSVIRLFNPAMSPPYHLWIALRVPPKFVRLSFFVCRNLCLSINVIDIYRHSQTKNDIPQTYPRHFTNKLWHCFIQPVWQHTVIICTLRQCTGTQVGSNMFLRT